MHPVKEMAQIVAGRPNILFMVDAITALGAMPLPMDDWGLDVVVSGSQKAFMLPTGLSFIALSKKAWAKHDEAKCPRYYFDLTLQKRAIEKGETYFSSSISLIRALDVALDHLTGKALLKSIRRSDKMAKAIRRACLGLGFKPFSKAPSPSVTALLIPDGVDGVKLRRHIEDKYNITVMGGQDKLQGKILRIGHLGYITDDDVLKTIEALYLSLNDMGQGLNKTALTKALKIAKKELK
jgi:aspartate aminotransferase-like enzyme